MFNVYIELTRLSGQMVALVYVMVLVSSKKGGDTTTRTGELRETLVDLGPHDLSHFGIRGRLSSSFIHLTWAGSCIFTVQDSNVVIEICFLYPYT